MTAGVHGRHRRYSRVDLKCGDAAERVGQSSYLPFAFGAGAPLRRAAQRAFIKAANRARPSAVNPPFFFDFAGFPFPAAPFSLRTLAQRAFCAAMMRARPSGEMVPRLLPFRGAAGAPPARFTAPEDGAAVPRIAAISASRRSICWARERARWSRITELDDDGMVEDLGVRSNYVNTLS